MYFRDFPSQVLCESAQFLRDEGDHQVVSGKTALEMNLDSVRIYQPVAVFLVVTVINFLLRKDVLTDIYTVNRFPVVYILSFIVYRKIAESLSATSSVVTP